MRSLTVGTDIGGGLVSDCWGDCSWLLNIVMTFGGEGLSDCLGDRLGVDPRELSGEDEGLRDGSRGWTTSASIELGVRAEARSSRVENGIGVPKIELVVGEDAV